MASEARSDCLDWPADELVSELPIAAKAIGVDETTLATALAEGQTMARVARDHGVKPRRVVVALVSQVVTEVYSDIRRGDLSPDQIRWLVTVATWRAEHQVTSPYPPIAFRPAAGAGLLRTPR